MMFVDPRNECHQNKKLPWEKKEFSMKLTGKINPMTIGNNHYEGGEFSVELSTAEALSIGPQLKAIGNTINNGDIINKIPQIIEVLANNKSKDVQALQAQIAELASHLNEVNEAINAFASVAGIRLVPPQPQQPTTAPFTQGPQISTPRQQPQQPTATDFWESKVPEVEKPTAFKSFSEIEATRKRNEREILSNLWDKIKEAVHGDSTAIETRDKITWDNMEVKFDRTFPKIFIKINAHEDDLQAILVNIYTDQNQPNKLKIADINTNLDLYENGYNLGFYQRKVMALVNGLYEEQLKK